jgi:hypothetical protein
MSEAEVRSFLAAGSKLQVATVGPDGTPHLTTLFYVLRDDRLAFWTYGTSQKVRNLERDPRLTCLVENGTAYDELRGVMMKCACAIHREPEIVAGVGTELGARYGTGAYEVTTAQAAKRVALQFIVSQTASWDHRKL